MPKKLLENFYHMNMVELGWLMIEINDTQMHTQMQDQDGSSNMLPVEFRQVSHRSVGRDTINVFV